MMGAPFEVFFADALTDEILNQIVDARTGGSAIDGVDETIVVRLAFPDEFPDVGSISLALTGPDGPVAARLERVAPYALFGDLGGDLLAGPPLPFGFYRLDIAAFARADGGGPALSDFSIHFELGPNRAPEALDDYVISEGTSTGISMLLNDSDPDGDTLSLRSVGAPLGGFAVQTGDDGIIYGPHFIETPNGTKAFIGRDVFQYVVSDGVLEDTATVYVDVEGVDGTEEFLVSFADAGADRILGRLQNAANYQFDAGVFENLTLVVGVSPFAQRLEAGDFQSVRLILDNGAVVRTENVAPYALFGDDTLGDLFGGGLGEGLPGLPGVHELQLQAFTGRNGGGDLLANAFFSFTANPFGGVNLPPFARDDSFAVYGTSTSLDVLFNDYDAELDALAIVSASAPLGGSLIVGAESIAYLQNFFTTPGGVTPFIGTDVFEYVISDGVAQSAAKVEVAVNGVDGEGEYRVELVDVLTDDVVADVFDDGFVTLPEELRGRIGISVTVSPFAQALEPAHVASLRLTLDDGEATWSRVEDVKPYALFGDRGGDFLAGPSLGERQYVLTVEAFTKKHGDGDMFSKAEFDFYIDFA